MRDRQLLFEDLHFLASIVFGVRVLHHFMHLRMKEDFDGVPQTSKGASGLVIPFGRAGALKGVCPSVGLRSFWWLKIVGHKLIDTARLAITTLYPKSMCTPSFLPRLLKKTADWQLPVWDV